MSETPISTPGLTLADRIARSRHESAGFAVWYLGQCGFLLQHRGLTVAVDPYLSDSVDRLAGFPENYWVRNYPPPVAPGQLGHVDLVLCTHDHLDHTDPETLRAIAAASPACRFAGPRLSVEEMRRACLDESRLTVLNEGQPFPFRDLVVDPIACAHEEYEQDADGFHRYLSYLLRWRGMTFYHAGDTVATPRLSARLAREIIDVAFLPINGGDEARRTVGVVGNMDAPAAARLAGELRVELVAPTHHDLYPCNGAEVAGFVAALEATPAPQPKVKVFRPGERLVITKGDRPRELAVILGAGKTGRGFLARLLGDSPFDLAFVDASEELVGRINADGGYAIHFFGGERAPYPVAGIGAALADSAQALDWMTRAAAIYVAVGEQNVAGLVPVLGEALDRRRRENRPKLSLFVCENGIAPDAPLVDAFASRRAELEIVGAAIFCSTIELPGTRLDIQSEPYDELPYDAERLSAFPALPWMKGTSDFPALLKRKIWTYNCFSGCIAYLGAYKHYRWYAEAAVDPEIAAVLSRIAEPLNQAIAKQLGVAVEDQRQFAQAALRKFSDPAIRDDIARNARYVIRKLSANDRLAAPARLIEENGGVADGLALAMAAALLYRGPDEKALEDLLAGEPVEDVFARLSGCLVGSALNRRVSAYFRRLQANEPLLAILGS